MDSDPQIRQRTERNANPVGLNWAGPFGMFRPLREGQRRSAEERRRGEMQEGSGMRAGMGQKDGRSKVRMSVDWRGVGTMREARMREWRGMDEEGVRDSKLVDLIC